MTRRAVVMLLWGALVAILLHRYGGAESPRRPMRWRSSATLPRPSAQSPLAGPSWHDPTIQLVDDDADMGSCTGTAFAIDDEGHWLTAHHVVAGCRQLAILTAPRHGVRVRELASHPRADVTVLASGPPAPPLRLGSEGLLQGQDGFSIGFPQGEAGDVHEALIGRVKMRRHRAVEPGLLWAEIEREPNAEQALSGLSGGPLVDRSGAVIGVTIAATPRRGRLASAPPESIRELVVEANLHPAPYDRADDVQVAGSSYAAFGDSLRRRLSVAKVLCWDREPASRRPPLRR